MAFVALSSGRQSTGGDAVYGLVDMMGYFPQLLAIRWNAGLSYSHLASGMWSKLGVLVFLRYILLLFSW